MDDNTRNTIYAYNAERWSPAGGEFAVEVAAKLQARWPDLDVVGIFGPPTPAPEPTISVELAELGDEITDGMWTLAHPTLWLEGDPGDDPVDYRDAVTELTCLRLDEFFENVAPGKISIKFVAGR